MVFSSPIFLFIFLPLVLAFYYVSPRPLRNVVLLLASLFFYAWGEGPFVAIMLASIAINFVCGLCLERYRARGPARLILAMGIGANLGLLGFFKYANFCVDTINLLLDAKLHIDSVHLPIGISFFTFQAMSYVIDVYRREAIAHHNPMQVGLYIALFPQLIAGPIVRYRDVASQIVERLSSLDDFAYGVRRFIMGLGKKVLIANPLGAVADQIFELPTGELTAGLAWLGIACYTLQIYFDFSGYSCMAIGLGRMFGFRFHENFNYPYIAFSMRDFWRRWHISLTSWFRDYLYIPMGGSRKGMPRTYVNLLIVFLLCGMWHGASWNFAIWGLLHGAFLIAERIPALGWLGQKLGRLGHVYVLLVVMVGWVFFRAETISGALGYLGAMFGLATGNETVHFTQLYLNNQVWLCLLVGAVIACPVLPAVKRQIREVSERTPSVAVHAAVSACSLIGLMSVLLLSLVSLAAGTYNPFIYFRF